MTGGGILTTTALVKPWGRSNLPAVFASPVNEPVGEIWFERPQPLSDILAKYLFTEERLSVQVHPTAENSPTGIGKDECWLVTEVEPGARLAVGFQAPVDADAIRRGALDGSIMQMLEWIDVKVNDFIYVPAGTVHSMGAGLTLIEIQQNTDITHRLYDYGRGRPLNLDEAMASIRRNPHPTEFRRRIDPTGEQILVEGPHFLLAQCTGNPSRDLQARLRGAVQVLPIDGSCSIDGAQIEPGAAGWADCPERIDFSHNLRCLLIANPSPLFQNPSASEY